MKPQFPPHIACVVLHQQEHGTRAAQTALPEELAAIPPLMHPGRRAQYLLGRMAAHQALELLGRTGTFAITRGKRGDPLWPPGFVGSISHSSEFAIAAVAHSKQTKLLGIDLQDVRKPLRHDVAKHICTEGELRSLPSEPEARERAVLRIFSAKESVFKSYYPLLQRYIGFQEVALQWSESLQSFSGEFISPHALADRTFRASCESLDGYIFTSVVVAA